MKPMDAPPAEADPAIGPDADPDTPIEPTGLDDPDAPAGDWVHWVLFNLAPDARSLPENVARNAQLPGDAVQGLNDYGRVGYDGPCPPPGPTHRYFFKVFALDVRLSLDSKARKPDLLRAMQGHVLAQGALACTYARKPK